MHFADAKKATHCVLVDVSLLTLSSTRSPGR